MDAAERRRRATGEAAEWLLRLRDGRLTRDERIQYVSWLRESPLHVTEMLQVSRVDQRLAEFRDWGSIKPADPIELVESSVVEISHVTREPPVEAASCSHSRWAWAGALAASLGALVMGLLYLQPYLLHTFDTGVGERRLVKLSDGSIVQLSPSSAIRIRYTDHERDVVLTRGDAMFRVAKNVARPFIVETDHTRVRAVGTAFGVQRDSDSVVVTVEEGRVAVLHSPQETRMTKWQPDAATEVSLGANQQVTVPALGPVGVVRSVDSRRELAWADGRLIFDNDDVATAVRQFNRFNRTQIELHDAHLASRQLTAVFDASDPEAFVVFLESTTNVRVTRPSGDRILIESEGPN